MLLCLNPKNFGSILDFKNFQHFAEFQKTYFEIFQRAVNRVLRLVISHLNFSHLHPSHLFLTSLSDRFMVLGNHY